MAQPTFGVPVSIDGIPPKPPALTLVNAATLVPTDGDDRWLNGAAIWPYSSDLPDVFDPCQASSSAGHAKDAGTPVAEQLFGAFTVLEGITCTTRSVRNPAEWQGRAAALLEGREHWGIEHEFWSGALKPLNPHLAQPNGFDGVTPISEPNGTTATSIKNAIALLEQAIADAGGDGVIHVRPAVFSQYSQENGGAIQINSGVARTPLQTPLVPGVGYLGSAPDGTAKSGTVEWAYATGPIQIRRSEVFIVPGSMREATDRAQNVTTFRAERHVLITWDQRIHAAVKIDRAYTTFSS